MKHALTVLTNAAEEAESNAPKREAAAEAFARDGEHERAENLRAQAALDRAVATDCRDAIAKLEGTEVRFNINHYVHVQLTPHGRQCLLENYDELAASYGGRLSWAFSLPEEDEDGWSKWQMHDLISSFGKHLGMGKPIPFETTVRVETRG